MKRLVRIVACVFGIIFAENNVESSISIEPQWNIIHLKSNTYEQFSNEFIHFRYNQSVGFPALALDFKIKSKKYFKGSYGIVAGVKAVVSKTSQKVQGLVIFENDVNLPEFLVSHDINICSINPYCGIIWKKYKTHLSLTGGVVLYDNLLKDLSFYENTINQGYAGARLKSKTPVIAGRIGFSAQKNFWDDFFIKISYEYTRGFQSYKRHVYIERPSVGVQEFINDIYLLQGIHNIELLEAPTIKFGIHTLSIGIGLSI